MESSNRLAWNNWKAAQGHWTIPFVIESLGAASMSALAVIRVNEWEWSFAGQAWTGVIAFFVALLVWGALTYIWYWVQAPRKQLAEFSASELETAAAPQQPTETVGNPLHQIDVETKDARAQKDGLATTIAMDIAGKPHDALIERVVLVVAGEQIDFPDWKPTKMQDGNLWERYWYFPLPENLTKSDYPFTVKVWALGAWWPSVKRTLKLGG